MAGLSDFKKIVKLEAGGTSSTWLPLGTLVEHYRFVKTKFKIARRGGDKLTSSTASVGQKLPEQNAIRKEKKEKTRRDANNNGSKRSTRAACARSVDISESDFSMFLLFVFMRRNVSLTHNLYF